MFDTTSGSLSDRSDTNSSRPILSIQGLRKRFDRLDVLKGIDLDVRRGEVIGLIGPSGSGKSTLLRCINYLETPNSGTVRFRDQQISPSNATMLRREIGMVFQRFNLFPHLTALENVCLAPRRVLGWNTGRCEKEGRALLDRVQLGSKADNYPGELSGGQQQRVAIARALAVQPAMLLFDEPTSALDPELVGEVLAVIRALAREGNTMLVATHEMSFCRELAHRILFLDGGVIVEEGPPEQVFGAPREERTRTFLTRVLDR